ncbi:hypothetical protein [Halocatena marina]|uniref:Metal-dependent hydrolase n=1 Tax=Halocatena marina TaxID=2934937 RepID=A0ABD5YUI4_9EURY|nr:hypothetical protein [Halocatena marina]
MTGRSLYVGAALLVGISAVVLGAYPIWILPIIVGVLIPNIDTIRERFHRSWLFHTFLAPTLAYKVVINPVIPWSGLLVELVHFTALGMMIHFVFDYIYPQRKQSSGSEWPIRPSLGSEPWGIMLLGIAWFVQWFLYLAPAFLPWLFS